MMEAKGRVVMITGANRGIGAAITRHLADQGYGLSLGMRRPDAGASPDAVVARYEAGDPSAPARWVQATLARFGRIDAVVANAGIIRPFTVETEDEAALDEMWAINVKGPLRLVRAALPALKQSGQGRVIVVSSLSGKRLANTNAGYAMSKFAAVALVHAVRQLGWAHGIRATALCPGSVATDMSIGAAMPFAEMTQPEDLAALVATLLALPNNASVAELLVNCRFEASL
jgi:NAD(P)-dependent dehydrogenase (short-subunit alcohol dehydrogenase family)